MCKVQVDTPFEIHLQNMVSYVELFVHKFAWNVQCACPFQAFFRCNNLDNIQEIKIWMVRGIKGGYGKLLSEKAG